MEEGSDVMAYWRRSPRQMQAATNQVAVAPTSPVADRPKSPRSRMMRQYDLGCQDDLVSVRLGIKCVQPVSGTNRRFSSCGGCIDPGNGTSG
jgi:hypothetical protein